MRKPTGYTVVTDPDAPTVERDTVTCGHCQRVVFVKPGTVATVYLVLDRATRRWQEEPGALCRVCMRSICLLCHDDGRCTPWERRLAQMESRDRLYRTISAQG